MRAIDILKWVCYVGKESDYFNVLEIDEDFDFESFFGYDHDAVEPGNYFFFYTDCVEDREIVIPTAYCRDVKTFKPDFFIKTEHVDEYGENVLINFWRIED